MFSSHGLFKLTPCPERERCKRPQCIFSHSPDAKYQDLPTVPVLKAKAGPSHSLEGPSEKPSTSKLNTTSTSVPAKRPASTFKSFASSSGSSLQNEPPKKVQKTAASSQAARKIVTQASGVPILAVSPANSQVAIPVRQAMLKTIYEAYLNLYSDIPSTDPALAAEHALAQEAEIYGISTKMTYRNAVISSVATLKKRPKPNSIEHDSVGTESTVQRRRETREKLKTLAVTRKQLEPHVMPIETMKHWGFVTEIPDGPGGSNPSEEGRLKTCERCSKIFVVKRKEEADTCVFHWGRARMNKVGGEKLKMWTCCSEASGDSEGCVRGPHVFYESEAEDLHKRHPFSFTRPPNADGHDKAIDVVCLDCEMIYTTGGSRVARVSVVDGFGQAIFDEFVQMDEGVEVIDYNTRFSGIIEEEYKAKALLPLASIRASLDAFINSNTIIIGHGLENDLNTLRMIHHRCVDTAILYPHRAGHPFRRGLRELAREVLSRTIQAGGGTTGHSSVEDSVATLDLVRSYILNNPSPTKKPVP